MSGFLCGLDKYSRASALLGAVGKPVHGDVQLERSFFPAPGGVKMRCVNDICSQYVLGKIIANFEPTTRPGTFTCLALVPKTGLLSLRQRGKPHGLNKTERGSRT